jgi:hypothetical protein
MAEKISVENLSFGVRVGENYMIKFKQDDNTFIYYIGTHTGLESNSRQVQLKFDFMFSRSKSHGYFTSPQWNLDIIKDYRINVIDFLVKAPNNRYTIYDLGENGKNITLSITPNDITTKRRNKKKTEILLSKTSLPSDVTSDIMSYVKERGGKGQYRESRNIKSRKYRKPSKSSKSRKSRKSRK